MDGGSDMCVSPASGSLLGWDQHIVLASHVHPHHTYSSRAGESNLEHAKDDLEKRPNTFILFVKKTTANKDEQIFVSRGDEMLKIINII